MRTNSQVKVFNFQGLKQKSDFDTSSEKRVFHFLKEPVANQYLEVLRILVPPEILVPLEICAQFERYCLSSTG